LRAEFEYSVNNVVANTAPSSLSPVQHPHKWVCLGRAGLNEDLYKHGMVTADAVKPPVNEDVVKQSSKWTSISGIPY
jgi:hypothetical protein